MESKKEEELSLSLSTCVCVLCNLRDWCFFKEKEEKDEYEEAAVGL